MDLRRRLGYLPQDFGVYPKESAERLLHYFARLKGLHQSKERQAMVDYVLELTNLSSVRKEAVSSYSGGMKQRFGIAQLLLNRPQLIIVDEPTAGLDPAERNRFLNLLREIGHTSTVIFSTHIVEDVKELCQEMAILYQGQVLKNAAPKEATSELQGKIWQTTVSKQDLPKLESQHQVLSSSFAPDQNLWVRVYSDHLPGTDFQQVTPDLEDVYFYTLKTPKLCLLPSFATN
ncbi:MAG: ATP-binding cassette domain-containing protein, partial [Bacteroidota bacterium]